MIRKISLSEAAREVCYSVIKLAEDGSTKFVQILRVGKFWHPRYGNFEVTPLVLAEMKQNFDAGIRGIDVSFDYFHDNDKIASGWPKVLELRENGTELWANTEWTPRATKMLAEKEVKYFSPEFVFKWQNPETGVFHNNVLLGGGLTNRPFVKEMAAIAAAEGSISMEEKIKELEAQVLKLTEEKADIVKKLEAAPPGDMAAENDALKKKIAELEAALKAAQEMSMAEKKKYEEAKVLSEKEASFNLMLSEGKVCAAQKDAFMKGDMSEFAKNAASVNVADKGSSKTGANADREDRVIKLAEEKCSKDPKLDYGVAMAEANREIKE